MNQGRRIWLVRLQRWSTTQPRMSRHGHHKATSEHGAWKCHVKAQNLMSASSCECVVGDMDQVRRSLLDRLQTSHTPPPRMQSYDLRNTHTSSLTSRLSDGNRGGAPCHAVCADLSRDWNRERPHGSTEFPARLNVVASCLRGPLSRRTYPFFPILPNPFTYGPPNYRPILFTGQKPLG